MMKIKIPKGIFYDRLINGNVELLSSAYDDKIIFELFFEDYRVFTETVILENGIPKEIK